jgi:hypothetical protein
MTISLEEHVARPIYEAYGFAYDGRTINGRGQPYGEWAKALKAARAAIDAVRANVRGVERKPPGLTDEQAICAAHVVVETVKAKLNWLPKAKPMPYHDPAPDPAEAMLAEIEWLKSAGRKQGQQIADSVEIEIIERVEAMRAKCEAIARQMDPYGWQPLMQTRIADAIASLKARC